MIDGDRLFISLLGPPNSGKSTLTNALCASINSHVIRPRDAIRQTVLRQPYAADLFSPIDDMGWASDYALAYAVRASIGALSPATRRVLLENLPWDALQLLDLQQLVMQTSSELVVLLIDATDEVLMHRGNQRRVCHKCEPDPTREPRRPAVPAADDPERCAVCSSWLVTRPDDSPAILARRIERSRDYLTQILRYADAARIPIHRLDGTQQPTAIAHTAAEILGQHCDFGF